MGRLGPLKCVRVFGAVGEDELLNVSRLECGDIPSEPLIHRQTSVGAVFSSRSLPRVRGGIKHGLISDDGPFGLVAERQTPWHQQRALPVAVMQRGPSSYCLATALLYRKA